MSEKPPTTNQQYQADCETNFIPTYEELLQQADWLVNPKILTQIQGLSTDQIQTYLNNLTKLERLKSSINVLSKEVIEAKKQD